MFDEMPESKKTTEQNKGKILLADDDASLRRFFEVVLRRAGYEVVSSEDGLEAMKTALEQSFDLVIADAVMPNLSGFDLCRILRHNAEYKKTPLIILSGMEINVAESEKYLADVYLLKHENLKEQLLETISQLLTAKAEN